MGDTMIGFEFFSGTFLSIFGLGGQSGYRSNAPSKRSTSTATSRRSSRSTGSRVQPEISHSDFDLEPFPCLDGGAGRARLREDLEKIGIDPDGPGPLVSGWKLLREVSNTKDGGHGKEQ